MQKVKQDLPGQMVKHYRFLLNFFPSDEPI